MKIQEAKDLQAACEEAARNLNAALAAACQKGMSVQIEMSESETLASGRPVVWVWPVCGVKPSNLEI